MSRSLCFVSVLIWLTGLIFAQQHRPTSPADESRTPAAVRSPYSMGADLKVPLCPAQFHDSLSGNGIANLHEKGVTPARIEATMPALMTQDAIAAAGKSHIGNFNVIVNVVVNTKGNPQDVCLQKSSGYGLDGSAATTVGQYHFDPAKKSGRPVKMRIPVEVRFKSPVPPPIGIHQPK